MVTHLWEEPYFARVVGIEPTVQVLETCGLPLTDTRIYSCFIFKFLLLLLLF